MTTKPKRMSLKGSLAGLPPLLKESGKGTKWCKFHLDVKGMLWECVAFKEIAEHLCNAKLEPGAVLGVRGKVEDAETREFLADIVLLPGEGETIETKEHKDARLYGSKEAKREAWKREEAYQAHYGRCFAYDAEGHRWPWAMDDTVMYNGKRYIRIEAEILAREEDKQLSEAFDLLEAEDV